ncbi:MAG: heavy metal translocating P-type ATPase metal-binding domain-containing protein, partial [Planctomycetota bacterium]
MNAALAPPPVQTDQAATACSVPCVHCGQPAPSSGPGPAFCCSGCRGAYALIHEWELEDYYALRDQFGGRGTRPDRGAGSASDRFAELDEPAVHGTNLRDLADGSRTIALAVDGLHCGACAWLIERSVPLVGGWIEARVDLPRRRCEIVFDPCRTTPARIARATAAFGYELRPLPESVEDGVTDDPDRPIRLRRIAAAGFCFANAMWLAVAIYAGRDGSLAPTHGWYLAAFGTALAAVSVLGPGRVFLRSAWASVRTRTPHIDLPIAAGLVAGAGAG